MAVYLPAASKTYRSPMLTQPEPPVPTHPAGPNEPPAVIVQPHALGLPLLPGAPRLSAASGATLRELNVTDESGDRRTLRVPVERPLLVRVDGHDVATLWTLGARPEWLVLGFLRNRRLVSDVTHLESVTVDWAIGAANVATRGGLRVEAGPHSTPGMDDFPPLSRGRPCISRSALQTLLATVEGSGALYRAAGSVQGCALFQGSDLWLSVEDVSRRNSFDIVTGWMALHGVSGSDKLLFTTGRLTAEVVMKAALNGIPVLISRKGITATCVDLATTVGMTLIAHTARRYICYAGAERFDADR